MRARLVKESEVGNMNHIPRNNAPASRKPLVQRDEYISEEDDREEEVSNEEECNIK